MFVSQMMKDYQPLSLAYLLQLGQVEARAPFLVHLNERERSVSL